MQQFQEDLLQSVRDMKASLAMRNHNARFRDTSDPAIQKAMVSEAKNKLNVLGHGQASAASKQKILG